MKRQAILNLLNNYLIQYPNEQQAVQRFQTLVETYPDCFERTQKVGHVTGSAWVVNQANTHVLLTHHKKLNKWLQLGGHADGESDILKAAMIDDYIVSDESHDLSWVAIENLAQYNDETSVLRMAEKHFANLK